MGSCSSKTAQVSGSSGHVAQALPEAPPPPTSRGSPRVEASGQRSSGGGGSSSSGRTPREATNVTDLSQENDKYSNLQIGDIVFYLEMFRRKGSGARKSDGISVWRETTLNDIDRASGEVTLIHGKGQKMEKTYVVNLVDEWKRIAPAKALTLRSQQMINGIHLNAEQEAQVERYLSVNGSNQRISEETRHMVRFFFIFLIWRCTYIRLVISFESFLEILR